METVSGYCFFFLELSITPTLSISGNIPFSFSSSYLWVLGLLPSFFPRVVVWFLMRGHTSGSRYLLSICLLIPLLYCLFFLWDERDGQGLTRISLVEGPWEVYYVRGSRG